MEIILDAAIFVVFHATAMWMFLTAIREDREGREWRRRLEKK